MKSTNPIIDFILETRYVCAKILMEAGVEGAAERMVERGAEWGAEQLAKLFSSGAERAVERTATGAAVQGAQEDLMKLWLKSQTQNIKFPSQQLEKIADESINKIIRNYLEAGAATADDVLVGILKKNPELLKDEKALDVLRDKVDAQVAQTQQDLIQKAPEIINYKFQPKNPQEAPATKLPLEEPLPPNEVAPKTQEVSLPAKPTVDTGDRPQEVKPYDIQKFVDTFFPSGKGVPTEAPPTTPKFPPDWKPAPITPRQPLPGEKPVEIPPHFDPNRPFWKPGTEPEAPPAPPAEEPIGPPKLPPAFPPSPEPNPVTPKPKPMPVTPEEIPTIRPDELDIPGTKKPKPGTKPVTEPDTKPLTEPDTEPATEPDTKPVTEPSPVDPPLKVPVAPPVPAPVPVPVPDPVPAPVKPPVPVPPTPVPPETPPPPKFGLPFGPGADVKSKPYEEQGRKQEVDLGLGMELVGKWARRQVLR